MCAGRVAPVAWSDVRLTETAFWRSPRQLCAASQVPKLKPQGPQPASDSPMAASIVATLQNTGYFRIVHQGTSEAAADVSFPDMVAKHKALAEIGPATAGVRLMMSSTVDELGFIPRAIDRVMLRSVTIPSRSWPSSV